MSRKWERMVEKNKKQLQQQRAKYGKGKVVPLKKPDWVIFHGRNMFLSLFLMSISVMFLLFFWQTSQSDTMFWVTVACYFLLSLYFFFIKRPYIKVGKSEIAIRRLGREKVTPATDVENIKIQPGYAIITIKGRRSHVIFSRFFNLYNIKDMAPQLKEFSEKHMIAFELEIN